jgi:hypothetical protein
MFYLRSLARVNAFSENEGCDLVRSELPMGWPNNRASFERDTVCKDRPGSPSMLRELVPASPVESERKAPHSLDFARKRKEYEFQGVTLRTHTHHHPRGARAGGRVGSHLKDHSSWLLVDVEVEPESRRRKESRSVCVVCSSTTNRHGYHHHDGKAQCEQGSWRAGTSQPPCVWHGHRTVAAPAPPSQMDREGSDHTPTTTCEEVLR